MQPIDRILRASLLIAAFLASAALWWPAPAQAARIKEVASVQGVRMNQLVGYGLVVGLDGTGDQTTSAPFATQSLLALLQQMGVTVPPGTNMQLKNLATVMVTAQLPRVRAAGPDDRRQRLVARQRQEPARRHADRDAAEGRRRPGLRDRPGQHGRRRRRRVGGRLEGHDQPPERRPHPRRRDGRDAASPRRSARATRSSSTSTPATTAPRAKSCARSTRAWAAAPPTRSTAASSASACRRRPTRASPSWPRSRTSTSSRRRRRPRS